MIASALPHFDPFDIHADSAIAQRWRKWIKRLENLFIAAAITDKKRQRALLLYYAGEEVCEIFETLAETGEDFATRRKSSPNISTLRRTSSMKFTNFGKPNRTQVNP